MDEDPRFQTGAYITDGTDLYEVLGLEVRPSVAGIRVPRIVVEDCRSSDDLELLPDCVRATFDLVRAAPAAGCPDHVEEIAS